MWKTKLLSNTAAVYSNTTTTTTAGDTAGDTRSPAAANSRPKPVAESVPDPSGSTTVPLFLPHKNGGATIQAISSAVNDFQAKEIALVSLANGYTATGQQQLSLPMPPDQSTDDTSGSQPSPSPLHGILKTTSSAGSGHSVILECQSSADTILQPHAIDRSTAKAISSSPIVHNTVGFADIEPLPGTKKGYLPAFLAKTAPGSRISPQQPDKVNTPSIIGHL